WTKGHPKRLGRTKTPISIAVGEPIRPHEPASELTAELHSTMERMLRELQSSYVHEPGAYWVPVRLGGTAPTLAEATALDDADTAARKARRAQKDAGTDG
ncbi:acyltransferase, partial [Rhodococcus rhodochrous KG-21]